jgi:hypothetical protein
VQADADRDEFGIRARRGATKQRRGNCRKRKPDAAESMSDRDERARGRAGDDESERQR